jgi:hypothetical protein
MRSFRIRFFREGFQGMTKLPAVRADAKDVAEKEKVKVGRVRQPSGRSERGREPDS